jgi:hypothetical protein
MERKTERAGPYVNTTKYFRNRSALLGELTSDRCVIALDTLAHAQKLMMIADASDLQIGLPSAYIDYLF